ncbi:MAG: 5-formyltetrahydrofolate cyclo-ligase [Clostridiales bacterium]|nr:5-formyltetrahydrofolate cyclo-ligase [Clostridiales bacterium]
MTKAEARLAAKAAVLKMSSDEKELASGAICDALSGLQEFKGAHSVFVYLGTETEPATDEIVGLALMLERTVAVPRVRGKEMDAVVISPFTNFKTNKWKILEPVGGHTIDDIDVAVIPLVAFDGLKRVGHGGGYYDRFLSTHNCLKIGIAFDCQCVSDLQVEDFDIPLDVLVTEKRIIDGDGEQANIYGEIK